MPVIDKDGNVGYMWWESGPPQGEYLGIQRTAAPARPKKTSLPRTPLTDLEKSIAKKLVGARFPPYSASKRFARDLGDGYIKELSDKGRAFMAYVVHRFRRQYTLTSDEQMWVDQWLKREG